MSISKQTLGPRERWQKRPTPQSCSVTSILCIALVPHLTYILLHIMVINKTSAFKKRKEAKAHDSVGRESVINTNNYAVRRLNRLKVLVG